MFNYPTQAVNFLVYQSQFGDVLLKCTGIYKCAVGVTVFQPLLYAMSAVKIVFRLAKLFCSGLGDQVTVLHPKATPGGVE